MENCGIDPRSQLQGLDGNVVAELAGAVARATQVAMMKNAMTNDGECDASQTVVIGLSAMLGALDPTTKFVGNPWGPGGKAGDGEPSVKKTVSQQAVLFASLLLSAAIGLTNEDHVTIKFGPGIVQRAMQAFEALTGEKADKYLHPGLAEMGRAGLNEPECIGPLADFFRNKTDHLRPYVLN